MIIGCPSLPGGIRGIKWRQDKSVIRGSGYTGGNTMSSFCCLFGLLTWSDPVFNIHKQVGEPKHRTFLPYFSRVVNIFLNPVNNVPYAPLTVRPFGY